MGHCSGPNYYTSIPAGASCDYEFGYAPSNPGAQCGAGTISFESGAVLNLMFAVGPVDGVSLIWGDGDCSGSVSPVDSLKTLKTDAGFAPTQTLEGCPAWGSNVTVNGISVKWGDVDFDAVFPVAGWISPVPGGVGPLTVAMLLKNTVEAARLRRERRGNEEMDPLTL